MLVCASIITQPIESQGNKRILLRIMQGNYSGSARDWKGRDWYRPVLALGDASPGETHRKRREAGGSHPPHSGAFPAVRATLRRASCWLRSRFSARGPGWPARLDRGQGGVALTGNLGCQPGRPRKPRRLGATSSLSARCGDSAAGCERQIAHYLYLSLANYIPQFLFRQTAQAILGQSRSRNILRTLDLSSDPITSKIALLR
jgi:hypothetical protein